MLPTLLSVLALQLEPRFVMRAEPGDTVRAELFEVESGLTDDLRRTLLGDGIVRSEETEAFPGWGHARLIGAIDRDGGRTVLFDAPGHDEAGDRICRVSGQPGASVDSLARAARWCASFFAPPVVFMPGPPVPQPSADR